MTKRVTGLGGVFFKAKDRAALGGWYKKHLGLPVEPWGGVSFRWRDEQEPAKTGATIWSPFEEDTDYFAPSEKPFMFNFRVSDLKRVLAELKKEGVAVDERIEESEFGKFGWIMDPEGNRIELWQPPVAAPKPAKKKVDAPKKKTKKKG